MESTLQIFDTKLREKVPLKPSQGNVIRMYTCGPTVYNFAHIGNLRTYIFEDLLRRAIKYFGMEVFQVMNLTDVDDKTIRGALQEKLPLAESTKRYKDAFFEDLNTLRVEKAEVYPAATDHIQEMICMIEKLIAKEIAYIGQDGNVFYRLSKFPLYGQLSHLHLEDLQVGASGRVREDEYDKENISDFVLWKAYDKERDGDIYWESPWGKGRPGWHIECSAMAMHYLGETLDLHVGGVDNIFPHHENEIAQSEGCTGKTFARHWMHAQHLIVEGKKMSKSLGNFFTLRDLLQKGYEGREVRYLLLSTHYRASLNFTFASLDGARHALRRLDDFKERVLTIQGALEGGQEEVEGFLKRFKEALADDLNISEALKEVFDFVRQMNSLIDQGKIGLRGKEMILTAIQEIDQILSIWQKDSVEVPEKVKELASKRALARKEKNWALADELRKEIVQWGYTLEDTPSGQQIKPLL